MSLRLSRVWVKGGGQEVGLERYQVGSDESEDFAFYLEITVFVRF